MELKDIPEGAFYSEMPVVGFGRVKVRDPGVAKEIYWTHSGWGGRLFIAIGESEQLGKRRKFRYMRWWCRARGKSASGFMKFTRSWQIKKVV